MSYLVLARKFRPQTFASVVGQEHITKALANAIVRGKVAHAFLFTGPRGVGKTSTARVLARALNCTGRPLEVNSSEWSEAQARERVEPCGECANCREIAKSASLGVWEIDGASNNSVDNVRELVDSLRSVPPAGSRYKIYIIDEVHMLSTAAFNALLKSLEEPPPHTIFIFATTEPQKIPETVLSRCQRYDFHRLPLNAIIEQLRQIAAAEGIEADGEVFEFIARKAEGGMRDAQTLLDRLNTFSRERLTLDDARRVFGAVGRELFFRLGESVLEKNVSAALKVIDEAFSQSLELRDFVGEFLLYFRNLLIVGTEQARGKGMSDQELRRLIDVSSDELGRLRQAIAEKSVVDLQRLFDLAQKTVDLALTSNFPRYVVEAGVTKMATVTELEPLGDVISRLESVLRSEQAGRKSWISTPSARERFPSDSITDAVEDRKRTTTSLGRASFPPVQAQEEVERETFDPVWSDFVEYVRVRPLPALAATLCRVTPIEFSRGKVLMKAGGFDLTTLRDPEILQTVKSCLQSYSGIAQWQVRVDEFNSVAPLRGNGLTQGLQPSEYDTVPTRDRGGAVGVNFLPGSLAHLEAERERAWTEQIDAEARSNPMVQNALLTFKGSRIERVSILKR